MQFYYVKENIALSLAGKQLNLEAPASEALLSQQIPIRHIRCGNISWEVLHAQKIAGDGCAVGVTLPPQIQSLLPPRLMPASLGASLFVQIQTIFRNRPPARRHLPMRLALINGVGTMLGDTLVGAAALEIVLKMLSCSLAGKVEVHAILAWNARPGAEHILGRSPVVSSVLGHSVTLEDLCAFDAYWDFSSLLQLDGYDSLPLFDFYLNQLGIDPSAIDPALKLPVVRLPSALLDEAKRLLAQRSGGRKVIALQSLASTPLRSMPDFFAAGLADEIAGETDACILLTQPLPAGLSKRAAERILHLEEWCRASTDHYLALLAAADAIVSIDSLAIHAAMAAGLPGVAIFTTLHPELRLAYAPRLFGMLIPGADTLKTWGKHKTDDAWPQEQLDYDRAWSDMDRAMIVKRLKAEMG